MACDLVVPLWGRGPVGFSGCLDSVPSTHNRYAVERPREVRAVRRALFLPSGERANGPQGAGSAGAQHPAAWRASLPFDAEEAALCARQRGLQFYFGDGFLVLVLKDESERRKRIKQTT